MVQPACFRRHKAWALRRPGLLPSRGAPTMPHSLEVDVSRHLDNSHKTVRDGKRAVEAFRQIANNANSLILESQQAIDDTDWRLGLTGQENRCLRQVARIGSTPESNPCSQKAFIWERSAYP